MTADDLAEADRIQRLAFATFRGLPPSESPADEAQHAVTRFRAAPDCAWVAESDGAVVGSVFVTRWGSYGFFGPLTVHPDHWDGGIGSLLLQPVLEAFERWDVRQAGLFTFADSPRHVGLYQKHGFWPRFLTAITTKPPQAGRPADESFAAASTARRKTLLDELRALTDAVFPGLDLEREVLAAEAQGLGDTLVLHEPAGPAGLAVCHCGRGSEAGAGACYVKFAAVRPGEGAESRFERLVEACESLATASGLERLVAGVNTGRLAAYRQLLRRGFRIDRIGLAMSLRPELRELDTPADFVLDDLR